MFFNRKQAKQQKPSENFLLYVPHQKHKEWTQKDGFVYLIFHHNHPVQRLANWLVKKSSVSDLKLDALGSEVWLAIDGQRNIHEIGEVIRSKFGADCEPLYERLIMFLRYLNRRGWIYFENTVVKVKK